MTKPSLLLYVPVIHRGYIDLLHRLAPKIGAIFIFGTELTEKLKYLERDISSLAPDDAQRLLTALNLGVSISILTPDSIPSGTIILINDAISKRFNEIFLDNRPDVIWETVFLRWDESYVSKADPLDIKPTENPHHRDHMERAYKNAEQSGDWWRRCGAVLVTDDAEIDSFNIDMPDDQSSYHSGNIRDYLKVGEKPEFSNTIHAETRAIAEAARRGIKTEDATLYTTHFPCPVCAKTIAVSGIKYLAFAEGSANFDAKMELEAHGIQLIYVPKP